MYSVSNAVSIGASLGVSACVLLYILRIDLTKIKSKITREWTHTLDKFSLAKFFSLFSYDYYSYNFKDWVYRQVVPIETRGNFYMIPYHIGTGQYKFPIAKKRRLVFVTDILTTENGIDRSVKEDVIQFSGYARDFHGISMCPKDLGYTNLKFILPREEKTFSEDQIISYE